MTPALELLTDLRARGARFILADGKLRYEAPQGVISPPVLALLREHKAALLELLEREELRPRKKGDPVPASFAQERIWFLEQLDAGNGTYHTPILVRLVGRLDADALERSFGELVRRHEVLRTTFRDVDGRLTQIVHDDATFRLERVEATGATAAEREAFGRELLSRAAKVPFDLANGPMIRALLVRLGPEDHLLAVAMHHITLDGWSAGTFTSDLSAIYGAFAAGKPSPLPELTIQYADYAVWQRARLEGSALAEQLTYWKEALRGAPTSLELPSDRPRPAVKRYVGSTLKFTLPETTAEHLRAFCRDEGATLFMVTLAAYAVLLGRWSRQNDLVIGAPIAGRTHPAVEPLIGMFVNTLALRVSLEGSPTFRELVARVRKSALGAFAHQDVPFERVVEELNPPREASRTPLFQVVFAFQNVPMADDGAGASRLGDVEVRADGTRPDIAQFDLSFFLFEQGKGMSGWIEYETDLFDRPTIERFVEHFGELVGAATRTPDEKLSRLPLMTEAERRRLLVEWNATDRAFGDGNMVRRISELASVAPERTAIVCGETTLSYGQLDADSNRIARLLRDQGIGPEDRVATWFERSAEMIVAAVGVWKAGAAYVPLDPALPDARLAYMIEDAGVKVALSARAIASGVELGIPVILTNADVEGASAEPLGTDPHPRQAAYLIYTSGTTGKPKAAVLEHAGLWNMVQAKIVERGLSPEARVTQVAAPGFDAVVLEIWPGIAAGAAVHVVPDHLKSAPSELVAWLRASRITHSFMPTPLAESVLDEDWSGVALLSLETGGDALKRRPAQDAPFELMNLYGPTETTVFATEAPVAPVGDVTPEIGRPIANLRAYVVDEEGQPVPIGVPGELWIGGPGVGRGYHGRPALTAERFVPDPFSGKRGARVYRTGDLVRWKAQGTLEFLGRIDHQVKIRGFRIELGEIEAALLATGAVSSAVVVAREDAPGTKRLVAYVVPQGGASVDVRTLRQDLAKVLPEYLVPSACMVLEALPLTPNGKVDRKALPAPEPSAGEDSYVAPRTDVEAKLARVFADVLRVPRVGVYDDFFALGGDSIQIIQLVARARREDLHLSVKDVYTAPAVAALAEHVQATVRVTDAEQGLVVGDVAMAPAQHWYLEHDPVDLHHYNQSFLLRLTRTVDRAHLEKVIGRLASHHDALRLRFVRDGAGWRAFFAPDVHGSVAVEVHDVSQLAGEARAQFITDRCTTAQSSLDVSSGPIGRVLYFDFGAGGSPESRLFFAIHHLVVDGVSWRILFDDLHALLEDADSPLPPKTTSLRALGARLEPYARSPEVVKEAEFWCARPWHEATAVPAPRGTRGQSRHVTRTLDEAATSALLTRALLPYRLRTDEALLTGFALALRAAFGGNTHALDLEGHGRDLPFDDVDLSRTVGWFTRIYPVLLSIPADGNTGDALIAVKEQLRAFHQRGMTFGLLRYCGDSEMRRKLAAVPPATVVFNYLGQNLTGGNQVALEKAGAQISPRMRRHHALEVNALVVDGRFQATISYDPEVVNEAQAGRLADSLIMALAEIVEHTRQEDAGALTTSDVTTVAFDQPSLDRITTRAAGRRSAAVDAYALTPLQQGLLFEHLKDAENDVYVPQLVMSFDATLDPDALAGALQDLVDRHEILRTSFHWEDCPEPVQVVQAHARVEMARLDWSDVPGEEVDARVNELMEANRRRGFDLHVAPLTRGTLVRTPDGYRFVWAIHHIVMDGWSRPVLRRDLFAFYRHRKDKADLALEPLPRFASYLEWRASQSEETSKAFFERTLAGFDEPTVVHPAGTKTTRWGDSTLVLSGELSSALTAAAKRLRLTMSSLVHAAWAVVLGRYTGRSDVLFGSTTSGRSAPIAGIERIVGPLINVTPVRLTLPHAPIVTWLESLQEYFNELRAHEHVSITKVQSWSSVPSGQALFECLITVENFPLEAATAQTNKTVGVDAVRGVERTHYPLGLIVVPGERVYLALSYDADRFSDLAPRTLSHLESVLRAFVETPHAFVDAIPLLGEEERREVLVGWNATERDLGDSRFVHEIIAEQARRSPDAVALVFEGERLTYRELDADANRLAHALRSRGVGRGSVVALCMDRSLELLVAVHGVVRSGAAYAPLDPTHPEARLLALVEDLDAPVVLTNPQTGSPFASSEKRMVVDRAALAAFPSTQPDVRLSDDDTAYIIFTSGSTGKPKGVMSTHGGMRNRLLWAQSASQLGPDDAVLQKTPYTFDVSVWELFWPLMFGSRLIIAKPEGHKDPEYIGRVLAEHSVTMAHFVPSMLGAFLETYQRGSTPALRRIVCSGEALPRAMQDRFFDLVGCELVNLYGPTEASIDVSYWRCSADISGEVPIGWPVFNTELYVVDSTGQPCPIGVPGELVIGGVQLARGYLRRPELTADRFIPDSFSQKPGARAYRTGDLAMRAPTGEIRYLGRLDHQVKVRGFRIELGEIESSLLATGVLSHAVVVAREDEAGAKRLVAYVVPASGKTVDVPSLNEALAKTLPEYMVPSATLVLEALPLTASGKVDRKALPAPDASELTAGEYAAPRTDMETTLARVFADVLRLPRVGIHDDFFVLGGDSIRIIQVVARARRVDLHLRVEDVYAAPTVAALAAHVQTTARVIEAEQGLVLGDVPLSPPQQWYLEREPADPHHFNQAFLVRLPRVVERAHLEKVVDRLARHHDALRLRFVREGGAVPAGDRARWRSFFAPSVEGALPLEVHDVSKLSKEERTRFITERCSAAQGSFDLAAGPIARILYFDFGTGDAPESRLFLAIHHFAVDGVSWRVLFEDLNMLLDDPAAALPPKTTSVKALAERFEAYARSPAVMKEAEFWRAQPWRDATSIPSPRGARGEGMFVVRALDETTTSALLTRALLPYRLRIEEALLAAFTLALRSAFGGNTHVLDLERHGRDLPFDDVDLSRTVGWFTRIYPILLSVPAGENVGESLMAVKEQLRAFQKRSVAYGLLRYCGDAATRRELEAVPHPPVVFNYLGQNLTGGYSAAVESSGSPVSMQTRRYHTLEVNSIVVDGTFRVTIGYDPAVVEAAQAERLGDAFVSALSSVVEHARQEDAGALTPSDVPSVALDQETLDRIAMRVGGRRSAVRDVYALTPLQEGFLFHHLKDAEEDAYVPQLVLSFDQTLDPGALADAMQDLVDRHDIYRTSFQWEDCPEPVQVVWTHARVEMDRLDWSDVASDEIPARLSELLEANRRRGFDLRVAPLTRGTLVRTPDGYRLIWATHHIITDGWSTPVLGRELFAFYEHRKQKTALALEPLPRLGSYVEWRASQSEEAAKTFFERTLAGFSEPTIVHPPPGATAVTRWGESTHDLTPELASGLSSLAKRLRLTPSSLAHAAWAVVLARYTGRSDVLFGSTTSGRSAPIAGVDRIVGPLLNVTAVRITLPHEPLEKWLGSLQEYFNELRSHEHVSITQVQGWSDVPSGQPLFESLLTVENYPIGTDGPRAAQANTTGIGSIRAVERTHYPLSLFVEPRDRISLKLLYDADRFSDLAPRTLQHLEGVLRAFVETPGVFADEIPLVADAERRVLLQEWNATERTFERGTIHEIVSAHCRRRPDAVAFEDDTVKLTCADVEQLSDRVAGWLASRGIGPGSRVAIELTRRATMVCALLGTLKTGAAYVPIEPTHPEDRRSYIRQDAGVTLAMTDALLDEALAADPIRSARPVHPEALCYVLYTSGSTGRPKGVAAQHSAIVNFLGSMVDDIGLTSSDVVLATTTLSFDPSTLEMYLPFIVGARVVVAKRELASDGFALAELIERSGATVLQSTPSTYGMLLDAGWKPGRIKMLIGGEALTPTLAERLLAGGGELFNVYGPTETTVWATFARVRVGEDITLGRPVGNAKLYVLDANQQPLPIGVPGELCLGGAGVAHGYWSRPELTAERFVPDPFCGRAGARMYRSGDLVRWRADGTLDYLGRQDDQVKVHGYRIELGEVGAALAAVPGIRASVVVARPDAAGDNQLVGYYVPVSEAERPTPELVAAELTKVLPAYMVPRGYVVLDALPLSPTGKIDRKKLPAPDVSALSTGAYVGPRTPLEETIAGTWREVLRVERVGVHDSYFTVGGHSLNAMRMLAKLRAVLGIDVPMRALFDGPTIAELARWVEAASAADAPVMRPPIERGPPDAPLVASYIQKMFVAFETERAPSVVNGNAAHLELRGPLDVGALRRALEALLERQEALRAAFDAEGRISVLPTSPFPLHVVDMGTSTDEEVEAFCAREEMTPFAFDGGPLSRFVLVRRSDVAHELLIRYHSAVHDSTRLGHVGEELLQHYRIVLEGARPMRALPIRYRDFALWERRWFEGAGRAEVEAARRYAATARPVDLAELPRKALVSSDAINRFFPPNKDALESVSRVSRATVSSLFAVFVGVTATLLGRWAGAEDVSFLAPVNLNKTREEFNGLFGRFTNSMLIRLSTAGDPTFGELAQRALTALREAQRHQDVPIALMLGVDDPFTHPLGRCLLNSPVIREPDEPEVSPPSALPLPSGFSARDVFARNDSGARNDVAVVMMTLEGGLLGGIRGAADHIRPETVEQRRSELLSIILSLDPDVRISRLGRG